MLSTPHRFILGGKKHEGSETLTVRNPFSNEVVGLVFLAGETDARNAVKISFAALSGTRGLSSFERSSRLRYISNALKDQAKKFSDLITREIGKPTRASQIEVERAAMTFGIAGEEASRISGEALPLDLNKASKGRFGIVRRFPIGTVLAVTPFNFPLNLVAHKIAPYRIDSMPYGGIKESGFGREGIRYAIESMSEPKLLVVHSQTL